MARRSIRTRLTLLVFAITAAALGFVFVYVAPPLERSLTDQFLDRMADEARRYAPPIVEARDRKIGEVKRIVARAGDRSNARVTLLRVSRGSLGLQTTVIADSVGPPDAGDLQFDVALEAARRRRTATGTEASTRGRLGQAAYPVRRGDAVGQVIVFSAPLNDVENNVALVRRRILVAGAIALLFALAAGSVVAARLSRRINRLERTARSVAHGDLSGRFVVDADDELGQLAVALDDMQRQLGQLDSARKRFIATASHELRTPIFSLGGFLELLQDEDVDPDTREAFLTQVRGQVERLKRLATDLLDLSKLEAGSLELEREPTDLGVLAEAVTSEFQPALARHESKLQLRLGAGMVEADVDPERVAQVMRILIDNALTHTPPGTNMVVTAARQDGQVRLSVRDNGGGIKRQTLERIFEPFYSAGDGQGSGLGLAIARELAERMDGHLSVEAMAGHTTFTLELPRVTHRLAIALAAAALAAGCGGSSGDPRSDGEEAPEAPATTVERQTRVEVIQRIGDEGGFDPKAVFRRDGPGVVTIRSLFTSAENGGDEEEPRGGVGSGFVISERGEIATNAHVVSQGEGNDIKRADEVYVAFADDNQVRATVVGLDPNSDVALLRLNTRAGLTLRPLELGSSDRVRVGEPVAAIGSPFGEEQSLSVGVVSALDRAIESLTGFDTLGAVQTDAAINQGNSGGPLLNGRGEVIGINAQIRTTSGGGEGVGYAIPIDQVKRSVEQIREDGEVRYAYLGVSTSPVYPQLDDRFRLGTDNGAWIQEVVEDGPADDAGLRGGSGEVRFQSRPFKPDGDVITKVEDTPIVSSDDVGLAITRYEPGETVEIEIVRDGERRTVRVKLGERPAQIDQPG